MAHRPRLIRPWSPLTLRQWLRRRRSPLRWMLIVVVGGLLSLTLHGVGQAALTGAGELDGMPTVPPSIVSTPIAPRLGEEPLLLAQASPLQTSYELYEAGQLTEAAALLEDTLAAYRSNGDGLREAVALSNLALVRGQMGQWGNAHGSVDRAIALLQNPAIADERRPLILAQSWTIKGQLYLAQGEEAAAFDAFANATQLYEDRQDLTRTVRSRINQAQALQANGFYRRAITEILAPLGRWLGGQPDSLIKAEGLHSLGGALLVAASTARAEATLQDSLAVLGRISERIEDNPDALNADDRRRLPDLMTAVYLSLGNTARSRIPVDFTLADGAKNPHYDQALEHYQKASASGQGTNRLRAQLNQLSLLIDVADYRRASALSRDLWPTLTDRVVGRDRLQADINFANSLLRLRQMCPSAGCEAPAWSPLEDFLAAAHQQAQTLGDRRSDAYITGLRGRAALQQQQWSRAQDLTEQALVIAAAVNAPEITYRWQEQLGQILEAQDDLEGAIAAYQTAVDTLKRLRTDLLAINPDLQFSFQQNIEPIHRKLVSLLIDAYEQAAPKAAGSSNRLDAARQVIESLQQEELNNYLRAACLDLQAVQIDQISQAQSTAVIYPIILSDRLATIVSYPGQGTVAAKGTAKASTAPQEVLELYPTRVSAEDIDRTLRQLRRDLTNRISLGYREAAQQVYDWVIRPLEADLRASGIDTLVFVLDGGMRNVPMAALFDGEEFLIEKYAIALTPGLQLLAPQPLLETDLSTLAFGLSDAVTVNIPNTNRQEAFSPLPNVEAELAQIQALLPRTEIVVNDDFTPENFRIALANTQAPIVHLATHGQFSSNSDETFIVASGGNTITIDDLTAALEATATNRESAVELLVLSACETATGDDRAALGLAGIAVRAGARSTLASLWQVDDIATSQLMASFYETLTGDRVTKAQALQAAQRRILDDPRYRRHPYFWAPFVMVGNWL